MNVALRAVCGLVWLSLAGFGAARPGVRPGPDWTSARDAVAHVLEDLVPNLKACRMPDDADLPPAIWVRLSQIRGHTEAQMPMPHLGVLGPSKLEACMNDAVARAPWPDLPERVAVLEIAVPLDAPLAPASTWNNLPTMLDGLPFADLLTCAKPRQRAAKHEVRVIFDRGTRAWVPPWTFRAGAAKLEPTCVRRKVAHLGAPALPSWIVAIQLDVPIARPAATAAPPPTR